jgi:hypothetical protein
MTLSAKIRENHMKSIDFFDFRRPIAKKADFTLILQEK